MSGEFGENADDQSIKRSAFLVYKVNMKRTLFVIN